MKMLVNRAQNLERQPIPRPKREGKTKRDHASGAWSRRLTNRQARAQG